MTLNSNLTLSKDQLTDDMFVLTNQSNFYPMLEQTLKQILESKTLSPYEYLHKKTSLRSKFDSSKASQYACQIALYLSSINPLSISKQSIINKLMSLVIDKFNHLKIKKFQANQFINFLLIDLGEREKDEFIKQMNRQKMENDHLSVMVFANVMYWTVAYLYCVKQVNQLTNKIKVCLGLSANSTSNVVENMLTPEVITQYLQAVDQGESMLKLLNIQDLREGDNLQSEVISRIFELFDGNQDRKTNNK